MSQLTQDEEDDLLIQRALDPENHDLDLNRELEPGEKADDAIDFEDISDDDLAEDEGDIPGQSSSATRVGDDGASFDDQFQSFTQDDLPGLTSESVTGGDEFDDLFGDGPSSPAEGIDQQGGKGGEDAGALFSLGDDLFSDPLEPDNSTMTTEQEVELRPSEPLFRPIDFSAKIAPPSREEILQQELFAMSRSNIGSADNIPAPPENKEELLVSAWPKFEPETVPRFMDLLPPKSARYVGKTPVKPPKPLRLTKVNLELAPDQAKMFTTSTSGETIIREDYDAQGLIAITHADLDNDTSEDDLEVESDYENEPVGGFTWQDIQVACANWDIPEVSECPSPTRKRSTSPMATDPDDLFRDMDEAWARQLEGPFKKAKPNSGDPRAILSAPQIVLPPFSLSDPLRACAKISNKVVLDLNDPLLLVEQDRSTIERYSSRLKKKGGLSIKDKLARYNISNDAAYDLLKENHQSKVRSTLGNVAVSHSMPALRLQWPYYKTKLAKQEARSFHRPTAWFPKGEPIMFNKPRMVKRKHMKGKDTRAIFNSTKDLSLGDNSYNLLLEYSEEHPIMMANFGMGSRLINYYRRSNAEDTTRPKLDIGETAVLLPEDKSPFSMFGHIDPGQITPAIHNSMYKAPVFKQEPKPTDFLMIRNATGVEGPTWYLRNIENIHVVGQQFPSVDVPGPHSRKVTTASKNRLKMISYRQMRRNKPHTIEISHVTRHFADSTDLQNRQKMKEFLVHSKETRRWEMKPGEAVPDEEIVRTMVKPEDVCLLEAMQVGQQHLLDSGFTKEGDETDEENGNESQSIEQQLAPWYTSRNFLNAASGKAMLQLHGEGDPSGRGEAFSFLKISMKGGFKPIGESVEDKLDAKKMKELGGHSYNVAKQQRAYDESIRRIWDGQKHSLSSTLEQSDSEMDTDDPDANNEDLPHGTTPRSEAPTPAAFRRRDDETGSQFSKFSTDSQSGKVLRIIRRVEDKYGNIETVEEVIRDPRVIKLYLKRRHAKEDEMIDPANGPTGDTEKDKRQKKLLEKELARLERNKDRRIARDKQKGTYVEGTEGSPASPASPGTATVTKGTGTQRKCANCGQVGHIKTNKKFCSPFPVPLPIKNSIENYFQRKPPPSDETSSSSNPLLSYINPFS